MSKFTDGAPFHFLALGGCASGGAFMGGAVAGVRGALLGSLLGIAIGIWNWRSERNRSS